MGTYCPVLLFHLQIVQATEFVPLRAVKNTCRIPRNNFITRVTGVLAGEETARQVEKSRCKNKKAVLKDNGNTTQLCGCEQCKWRGIVQVIHTHTQTELCVAAPAQNGVAKPHS
jgi:hypothetical protein